MADPKLVVTYAKAGRFEDVRDDLRQAIEAKGLVIDLHSHVNRMLERTGKDVGSARKLYAGAEAFVFCSAVVSRRAMEADPASVALCPYSVVVYETLKQPGTVHVAYRRTAVKDIDALLDGIAREAAGKR